jgi:hypothetical protein
VELCRRPTLLLTLFVLSVSEYPFEAASSVEAASSDALNAC